MIVARQQVNTEAAPPPGGAYSQAIVAGPLVFIAGQGPFAAPSGAKVEGPFADQARQTFRNLAAVAEAAGGSLDHAVRVGVFLRDMGDFAAMNEIFGEFFSEPFPARTTVQSNLPGFSIEVDAILQLDT
jgi:2-iminobutanoate/2-iminopropanoate deaminase